MKIALTQPDINDADLRAMEEAVHRMAIMQGEETCRFESEFAHRLGLAGAVATNSGTSALILALRCIGVDRGDEVILPSYTCLAVVNAVVQVGASPRLVDCSYDVHKMDYNITAAEIQKKITHRTAAVVVPHMFGVPAKVDKIIQLGIPVIEDITLSLGAVYLEKPVGAWGAAAVCSFHASKMVACGEGGAVAFNSRELLSRARYLNGWEEEQVADRIRSQNFPEYELRYNFHLNDVSASLGRTQLQRLDAFITRRRELAELYSERFSRFSHVRCPTIYGENVFFRYLVALSGIDPVAIVKRFMAEGIEAGRGVYPPLHYFFKGDTDRFPGTEQAVASLVSIPLYPALQEREIHHILSVSEQLFGEVCN